MKNQLITFLASTMLIAACSGGGAADDAPSENAAKENFLESDLYRREFSEGIVQLNNFKKTNGQLGEIGGVRIYRLFYEAEIEYLKDDPKLKDVFGGYTDDSLNDVLLRCRLDETNSGPRCRNRKAGDIARVTGEQIFEETENGWVSDVASITGTSDASMSSGRKLAAETSGTNDTEAYSSRSTEYDRANSAADGQRSRGSGDVDQLKVKIIGAWGAQDERKKVALVFADNGELTMFQAREGDSPATKRAQYKIVASGNLEIRPIAEDGSLGNPQTQELSFEGDSLSLGYDDIFPRISNLDDFFSSGTSESPARQRQRAPEYPSGGRDTSTEGEIVETYSVSSTGQISKASERPELLRGSAPAYPSRARSRGLEGFVLVTFTITPEGQVLSPQVESSTSSIFERSAIDAVSSRQYESTQRTTVVKEKIAFGMQE